jgi:hypothetical protein
MNFSGTTEERCCDACIYIAIAEGKKVAKRGGGGGEVRLWRRILLIEIPRNQMKE